MHIMMTDFKEYHNIVYANYKKSHLIDTMLLLSRAYGTARGVTSIFFWGCMRFSPTFCPLPKENFTKGTPNKDASGHVFAVL